MEIFEAHLLPIITKNSDVLVHRYIAFLVKK